MASREYSERRGEMEIEGRVRRACRGSRTLIAQAARRCGAAYTAPSHAHTRSETMERYASGH